MFYKNIIWKDSQLVITWLAHISSDISAVEPSKNICKCFEPEESLEELLIEDTNSKPNYGDIAKTSFWEWKTIF